MKTETTALTETQINDWKKQYGKIYKSIVGDEVVIFRKIKRNEYMQAMTDIDNEDPMKVFLRQDMITKMTTLYPNNIDQLIEENGALSTVISNEVLGKSGFDLLSTTQL
ncbi:hypothetical protein ACTQX2_00235 [Megamonas funiformis]|uniref:hypothetical protein n=1 Tax=Megamonas funiformis TaxID=437897 RepID=UPI003F967A9E